MTKYVKDVLALKCNYKLPVYKQKAGCAFLALNFNTDHVQVCRLKFHRHRDRFVVVTWSGNCTFQTIRSKIIKEVSKGMFDQDEVALDGVNLYLPSKLTRVENLVRDKKYLCVSTKANPTIDGLNLLEQFIVEDF